eukprot:scaffold2438_cov257-Pinguiococcus_pyrenoidosus.AAC.1
MSSRRQGRRRRTSVEMMLSLGERSRSIRSSARIPSSPEAAGTLRIGQKRRRALESRTSR